MYFYDSTNNDSLSNDDDYINNTDEAYIEHEHNGEQIARLILNQMQKTLIDHLANTKLEAIAISDSVITSLILLSKLYKKFLKKMDSKSLENEKEYTSNLTLLDPLLKKHLTENNSKSLSNFVRELDNSFEPSSIHFVDLLSKFFIYINLLFADLRIENRTFSINSRKLKDLFEWHSSNFNIVGLKIDTIPISKTKNKPSNENSLDNLLIMIVNTEHASQDESHRQKLEFCSAQTKHLVNTLNEGAVSNPTSESIVSRFESKLGLNSNVTVETVPTKKEFHSYFSKRSVFSNKFSKEELKFYEVEWMNPLTVDDYTHLATFENDFEIDLDTHLKTLFKSEQDLKATLVVDKNLGKNLANSLEQSNLDELFVENLQKKKEVDDSLIDCDSMLYSAIKLKNTDVINTRTGLKYKAPMRGGHSNPAARHMLANGTGSAGVSNLMSSAGVSSSSSNMMPSAGMLIQPNSAGSVSNGMSASMSINNRHDSFRARAPNTSRPASLHVDEYYKLENANLKIISNQTIENTTDDLTKMETDATKLVKPQLVKSEPTPLPNNIPINSMSSQANMNNNNNLNYIKNEDSMNRNPIRKSNSFINSEDLVNESSNNNENNSEQHFVRNNMNNNNNGPRFSFMNSSNNNNNNTNNSNNNNNNIINNNSSYSFTNNTRERSFSSGNLTSFNNSGPNQNNSNQNNVPNNNEIFMNQMPPPSMIPALISNFNGKIINNNSPQNQIQQQQQQQQNQQQINLQRFTRV